MSPPSLTLRRGSLRWTKTGKSDLGFPENPGLTTVALEPMSKWYWDRMAGIYLDGRRRGLPLAPARGSHGGGRSRQGLRNRRTSSFSLRPNEDCGAVAPDAP